MEDENNLSIMETETDMNELRQCLKQSVFFRTEPPYDKMVKNLKENPLLPLGCVATLGALTCGLWSFKNGQTKRTQMLMGLRIMTQGVVVTAIILRMMYDPIKKP